MEKYIKPTAEVVLTELSGGYAEGGANSTGLEGDWQAKGNKWDNYDDTIDDTW